ncbi:aquaporin-like protein [Aspergillus pseudoustus]|uniref:Aquaporin-like protein n=1 Tax=Aspergillus pseudoustus TaxID=1810923 RepID=A0ABR4ISG6_9EURO
MRPKLPHAGSLWHSGRDTLPEKSPIIPFAGRVGANQEFTLGKNSCARAEILQKFPDAAPWIPVRDAVSLKGFLQIELWKAATVEAIASCLLVYLTCFVAIGLGQVVPVFASGPVVPGLIGGLTALLALPLFIYSAGPVSGAHINPIITIATFFSRLCSLPRAVLYVSFQAFGAAVAGYLLRASMDTRSFIVPGCYIDTSKISIGSAFTIEATTDFALVFLSFGVGLDPRQREVFGPALGPIFVGLIVGMCTFFTGFSRDGYTGFSGNPARCFGAMVGSHFSSYHWIHWIGPLTAGMLHGVLYFFVPPYSREEVAAARNIRDDDES